jgi:hypothetical protein
MSATRSPLAVSVVLGAVPIGLRKPLLGAFGEIVTNFRQNRWEPSELNGGKLCEVVYTILRGYVDSTYPPTPSKPRNMVDACRGLEEAGDAFPRSVRIQIPRMLIAMYEIRSNRGVGHVSGDVDPNRMDAVAVLYMAKWIVSELVRVFHEVDTATATRVVDALIERETPIIWVIGDVKRVLSTSMSRKEKTLLLLHTQATASDADLAGWVEHPKLSEYRNDVLRPLHRAKLVEYDEKTCLVHISPLGVRNAEDKIRLFVDGNL